MAWETRRRGGRYYTRTRRVAGQVIREYVGTGSRASAAAEVDAARRRQLQADDAALRALDEAATDLDDLAELLASAALLAAGYHRHDRALGGSAVPAELPPSQSPIPAYTADQLRALVTRAHSGDETCLPELRRLLDEPRVRALFTDLAGRVRHGLIRMLAGKNLLLRETTTREMDQLQAGLLGPHPTPIERLLAERVAVGWLQVQEADLRVAAAGSARDSDVWQRRADHAHRRFLAALRALAAVRKLPRPAVQVNIAEQQVNVTG
jgi:hypothetical protein